MSNMPTSAVVAVINDDPVLNKVLKPEDVQFLPWVGSYFSDRKVFGMVDEYIMNPTTSREDGMKALYEAGIHGMGLDEDQAEVTDEHFDIYVAEYKEYQEKKNG